MHYATSDQSLSSLEWIALAMDAARRHQEAKRCEPAPADGESQAERAG